MGEICFIYLRWKNDSRACLAERAEVSRSISLSDSRAIIARDRVRETREIPMPQPEGKKKKEKKKVTLSRGGITIGEMKRIRRGHKGILGMEN